MAMANGHQPLADITAGRDIHAQAERGVLMDEAPVSPEQQAAFCLGEREDLAGLAVAHAVGDVAGVGPQATGEHVQECRFSGARLADDGEHFAFLDREADALAG